VSKRKLRLETIRVHSFVTAETVEAHTIRGGDTEQVNCQTNTMCTLHTIGGDCYQNPGGTYASIDILCSQSGLCSNVINACTDGVGCY